MYKVFLADDEPWVMLGIKNLIDCIEEWMKDVVDFDILPMLSEYWFDDSSKLQRWENILHGVFQ